MKDGCSCAAEGLLDLYFLQWPAEGDSAYFFKWGLLLRCLWDASLIGDLSKDFRWVYVSVFTF